MNPSPATQRIVSSIRMAFKGPSRGDRIHVSVMLSLRSTRPVRVVHLDMGALDSF
jgi:hypothetical protein